MYDFLMDKTLLIGALIVIAFHIATDNDSYDENKTDGIYESALNKIDNNQPLTKDEEQRLEDIINWCEDCNKPLRMCRHSK
jgi:hypothetical protein